MDLILNYPAADTAFIGLFMTAHATVRADWAAASSGTAWPCPPPWASPRLRLAVDEGNSEPGLLTKNGFTLTGEVHPQ